jgi:glycosyltransferase involved in cell wall biosynthesis
MKFSLVLGTVKRTVELDRLLGSLAKQSYQDFELIVVDQNPDDRLVDRLQPYEKSFSIVHLRSAIGLSKARNVGLRVARGEIIAFPDDDCWYPQDLLQSVVDFLSKHPEFDGLTGRSVDLRGEETVGKYVKHEGPVSLRDVWRKATSFSTFLTRACTQKTGGFNEDLGLGAATIYQGAEDIEYLIRALKAGCRIFYSPNIIVYHDNPLVGYGPLVVHRGYSYGCGHGRVLRREGYPMVAVAAALIRPLGGTLLSLVAGRFQKGLYHFAIFRGRLRGWLGA